MLTKEKPNFHKQLEFAKGEIIELGIPGFSETELDALIAASMLGLKHHYRILHLNDGRGEVKKERPYRLPQWFIDKMPEEAQDHFRGEEQPDPPEQ